MALTREEVRKVALLARLELTDEELDQQAKHINDLLKHVEILQGVDVTGIEPTSHSIPVYNVFREDRTRPCLPREAVLANAPEAREGLFVVPRIVEG
ncbi:MAG TPA: Asp-tRNA(Asn)/Glu-tRNA(Gln) amidotransferase subunit GatC [Chthonomonadaceae bacterium]|nr:Asp-tRNA(Asn)/Glu-tRNA(Gln) amidotransferase subunit GatC [Chthonomonadaceae bacterium]